MYDTLHRTTFVMIVHPAMIRQAVVSTNHISTTKIVYALKYNSNAKTARTFAEKSTCQWMMHFTDVRKVFLFDQCKSTN